MFDPVTNLWTKKATCPLPATPTLWNITTEESGYSQELYGLQTPTPHNHRAGYDPKTDEWQVEADMIHSRHIPNAWNANGRLYIGGSHRPYKNYIDVYNPFAQRWESFGNTPYNPGSGDSV